LDGAAGETSRGTALRDANGARKKNTSNHWMIGRILSRKKGCDGTAAPLFF
jgi:hypothetical protein